MSELHVWSEDPSEDARIKQVQKQEGEAEVKAARLKIGVQHKPGFSVRPAITDNEGNSYVYDPNQASLNKVSILRGWLTKVVGV